MGPSQYPEPDQLPTWTWTGDHRPHTSMDQDLAELSSSLHHSQRITSIFPARSSNVTPELPGDRVGFMRTSPPVESAIIRDVEREAIRSQNFGSSDDSDGDEVDVSDADSDYKNVRTDIAKFKDSVRKFRAEQRGELDCEDQESMNDGTQLQSRGRRRGRGRAGRGKGILRGPRKAAEPTGDIKFRMSQASQAFIDENYEEAKEIVFEVVRINAETYEAWTLLASIWKELGDLDKTLMALMYASHMRPKDVRGWLNAARFALEEVDGNREKMLGSAKFCYSSAVRANPKDDVEARLGKAEVYRELGNPASAIAEYERVLKRRPHDTEILRLMAETYIDKDDVEAAKNLYRESISFYRTAADIYQAFGWSDINIYVELYGYLGQHAEAIVELKSLSRWLLGRQHETFWDDITGDDREYDTDDVRRAQVPEFVSGRNDFHQYGAGLPLELRVKLGIHRLRLEDYGEALRHFLCLDPGNSSGGDKIVDYSDLYQEVADELREVGKAEEALLFYCPLQALPGFSDPLVHLHMGQCYLSINDHKHAEGCFQTVLQLDDSNIDARVHLAKLYEELGEHEQAFIYVNEVMTLQRDPGSNLRKPYHQTSDDAAEVDSLVPPKPERKSYHRPKHLVDSTERTREEEIRAARLQELYTVTILQQDDMRAGNKDATSTWMDAARELIDDFRAFKQFYPWDKYVQFLGYSNTRRAPQLKDITPLDSDLAAMADRISNKLGVDAEKGGRPLNIPENYRGIQFSAWLDMFLEYAFCLVRTNRSREAYKICEAARDSVVWYHSREDMFVIHVCWCACAVLANDEDTCVSTVRYFTKEYQFTTDSYKMFAALSRLCQSPVSWYSSGPTQKYMLRQIKAMDYNLVGEESKERFTSEKGGYSAYDESGQLIVNDDMDVALLMLYGHILYTGSSYSYALNYFLRAYALDPENPMVNLSIGLGYLHYALKRQAENRQFHIIQGMSFLFRYYDSRHISPRVEERQEAHYNIARSYHVLGLTHLALPYYSQVLLEARGFQYSREDLVRDAAYNLQSLYTMGGNIALAKDITDEWLII